MTFTVAQLLQLFVTLCGSLVTIGGAGAIIMKYIDKRKEPDTHRDKMLEEHEEYLKRDNIRLAELEASNKIIMKSLLAIMTHELDGNHTEQLKDAKTSIENYLINR